MTSSNHEHGASAARPPKATPLPESNATTAVAAAVQDAPCYKTEPNAQDEDSRSVLPSPAKKRPLAATASACPDEDTADHDTKTESPSPPLPSQRESAVAGSEVSKKDRKPPVKAKKTLKKKKKFSSILSGMMQPKTKKDAKDLQAEREALRQHLGGGSFAKVDKI
eukprot:jgi/Psemu1/291825/fgenesh1_pg.819_\